MLREKAVDGRGGLCTVELNTRTTDGSHGDEFGIGRPEHELVHNSCRPSLEGDLAVVRKFGIGIYLGGTETELFGPITSLIRIRSGTRETARDGGHRSGLALELDG